MKNLGSLIKFEYKKLLQRRITVISVVALLGVCLLTGGEQVRSAARSQDVVKSERAAEPIIPTLTQEHKLLANGGAYIDQALLDKALAHYRHLLKNPGNIVMENELRCLKQRAFRQDVLPYKTVDDMLNVLYAEDPENISSGGVGWFHLPLRVMPLDDLTKVNSRDFYARLQNYIHDSVHGIGGLTAAEVQYEERMQSQIAMPFHNGSVTAYADFFTQLFSVGALLLLVVTICVTPLFSQEYQLQTDALLLTSRQGRGPVIAAKLITGFSFTAGLSLLVLLGGLGTAMLAGGTTGAGIALQALDYTSPYPLTLLQAGFLSVAVITLLLLLHATFCMVLSTLVKTSFPALAAGLAVLLLPIFISVNPEQHRFLYQLTQLLPIKAADFDSIFSKYLFPLGPVVLTPAWFYSLFLLVALLICLPAIYQVFRRHQVR